MRNFRKTTNFGVKERGCFLSVKRDYTPSDQPRQARCTAQQREHRCSDSLPRPRKNIRDTNVPCYPRSRAARDRGNARRNHLKQLRIYRFPRVYDLLNLPFNFIPLGFVNIPFKTRIQNPTRQGYVEFESERWVLRGRVRRSWDGRDERAEPFGRKIRLSPDSDAFEGVDSREIE